MIASAVIILLFVVGFFAVKGNGKSTSSSKSNPPASQSTSSNTEDSSTSIEEGNTIAYSDGKFSPSTLTVKSTDTITLTNESSDVIQFDSNPHPQHTENSELNVGIVGAGETKSFMVSRKGTWDYHNHLESGEGGTIIVE